MKKYIAIIKDTDIVLSHTLLDSPDNSFMPTIEKYFLEVEDDYTTSELFDNEPTIIIETEQDKDELITEFTFSKNYTQFNKSIQADKDNLIKQWCLDQGKSQAECIKENDSSYNTKLESIITDQNGLKK